MNWESISQIDSKIYKCGYCEISISSNKGYFGSSLSSGSNVTKKYKIYICHNCEKPTFFDEKGNQTPGSTIGNEVLHINDMDITSLLKEANSCYTINPYTSVVMCCRKLLMNIAVSKGADENLTFEKYVNFLNDQGYIPPNGKEWVDSIRKIGNEANHKIDLKKEEDAKLIIKFIEFLLKFIYEMPGMLEEKSKPKTQIISGMGSGKSRRLD